LRKYIRILCIILVIYTQNRYNLVMIKSFVDKETNKIYHQLFSKKLPQNIQRIALRKLIMIDNAETLDDLRVPPANRLEVLSGDRKGQYSIRINKQYRICFTVRNNCDFYNVEIVDYH
jgi:proteic killer suppression protein